MVRRSLGISLAVLTAAGVLLLAAAPRAYTNPVDAAEGHGALKNLLRHYERDGYTRTNTYERPFRRLLDTSGDYDWGTVTFRFQPNGRDLAITVTAYLRYSASLEGYGVTGFDVQQQKIGSQVIFSEGNSNLPGSQTRASFPKTRENAYP